MKQWKKILLIYTLVVNAIYAETHRPEDFLKQIRGTKDEGAQIVQHFCANCHAINPLIELGAPKINQKNDWEPRLKQGFKQVLAHTMEGIGAMPARGGCFECSDEQLTLAVLAMLPVSLQEQLNKELKENK